MRGCSRILCVVWLVVARGSLVGCDAGPAVEYAVAVAKVENGNVAGLTASEILALNQTWASVVAARNSITGEDPVFAFTNQQAGALVSFFQVNEVRGHENGRAEAFANKLRTDPGSLLGLPELATAIAGTALAFDFSSVSTQDLLDIFRPLGEFASAPWY